jgi:hypothetical protein
VKYELGFYIPEDGVFRFSISVLVRNNKEKVFVSRDRCWYSDGQDRPVNIPSTTSVPTQEPTHLPTDLDFL